MGVPHRLDLQVDQAVAADLVEHVVKEVHARVHFAAAAAVEPQAHAYVGFAGDAVDAAGAHGVALLGLLGLLDKCAAHIPVMQ